MSAIRVARTTACAIGLVACSDATAPEPPERAADAEIELLVDVGDALRPTGAPAGSLPVSAGIFMTVPALGVHLPIAPAIVVDRARRLVEDTNGILAQCRLHLAVEAVQVIAVPPHLDTVQGNERGSWGGHPPDSVGDPDRFTYDQNEWLTSETRELFGYGKRYTSKNAIAVFIVEEIEYYIGEQRTAAGGLSFPPVAYHHVDDYPLRNSVLVRPIGRDPYRLPYASGFVVAHELGHMLLDTGDHAAQGAASALDEFDNLMTGGSAALLTSEQCDRMHTNRERLYGDASVHDPGPPGGG